ncbi:MAG: hypothetical protein L0228_05950 [Planctomycetes bacterium]|nr:hypothetical protein [Planctomycetota bacterium]
MPSIRHILVTAVLALGASSCWTVAEGQSTKPETLPEITARLGRETNEAYNGCPFSALSKDYFSRFSLSPNATPEAGEVAIDTNWRIILSPEADPLAKLMAEHLQMFLRERMKVNPLLESNAGALQERVEHPSIVLLDTGGGDPNVPESFTIRVDERRVTVHADSPNGLRDGVVRLVDRIGFREAPILQKGETTYAPRLRVRLGAVPAGGSYKDAVFFGYNAVLFGGGDLFALSQSDAIPELAARRVPGLLESNRAGMKELGKYGLKAYAWLNTRQKFPKDDPVLLAHPEIRGALTWSADGEYTLCTSHPLVRRYLQESIEGLFKSLPELQGVALIIGGEGFYHCHMRPFGVEKGHTNCARCELLGAEAAVADLCNDLASAARSVNPNAEVVVWPYSAEHVWAADAAATGFLEKLKPGTALLTEVEKSETIEKPRGVRKDIWDYSIDFIGPAMRTRQQIAACAARGIPVYLKSEPELSFEAPRLPQVPCMDRWADRAEALASCGADGAWVFPAFRPFYGTSTGEINKLLWWTPVPERERLLHDFARRIAGNDAATNLREAWKEVSAAVAWSPELPPYYTGPYYLGPMHPMCANRQSVLPEIFYGQFLFRAEAKDAVGLTKEPTFFTDPRGDVAVFGDYYRKMHEHLQRAAATIREADRNVDERHRLTFDAEASSILWFYHTARTHANFYQSCAIRESVTALLHKPSLTEEERANGLRQLARWKKVLEDEKRNAEESRPLLERDMRLDPYYGSDHTFSHGLEMIDAKLLLLEDEIRNYLPSLKAKLSR